MIENRQLLIHLGGLGDLCLSESTICSVTTHFAGDTVGLGYARYLTLFRHYFHHIERAESRRWLSVFGDGPVLGPVWKRIVFIGKDRSGLLRQKWCKLSADELVFIDMFPETPGEGKDRVQIMVTDEGEGCFLSHRNNGHAVKKVHVEKYQLDQLGRYGIVPVTVDIHPKRPVPIILYPEKGLRKNKWDLKNFLILYKRVKETGHDVCFVEQEGLCLNVAEKRSFGELTEVKDYLSEGGLFISNDSGMAHLAGSLGLATITVFTDQDPGIWHPKGRNVSFRTGNDASDIERVLRIIEIFMSC